MYLYENLSLNLDHLSKNTFSQLLQDNFTVVGKLKTGAYLDSKECYSEFGCTEKVLTDNINKVICFLLAIHELL